VGGAGEAQILFANHFPSLFARIAGGVTPLLLDPHRPQPPLANLFAPGSGGRTRGDQPARRFSVHAVMVDHPRLTLAAAAVAATVVGAMISEG
jgi:hypothetical protein